EREKNQREELLLLWTQEEIR
ncbi:hypothetical protein ACN38_g11946, partial [Penicillium nordicum]